MRLAALALLLAMPAVGVPSGAGAETPPPAQDRPESSAAVSAVLRVDELGFDSRLRVRVYHDPAFLHVPAAAGRVFLVAADSASGKDAFFIPSDLAFEVGSDLVYPVELEQASDLLGRVPGGRLREAEIQLGFVVVPPAVPLDRFLPAHPESVVLRYAHHRAPLGPAPPEESAAWRKAIPPAELSVGLNAWWEWLAEVAEAPPMDEGDRRFLAERVLPGQGHFLAEEGMSAEGLRNAILRVGERRLLEARSIQRVAPVYPAAARQVGVGGMVVALCYVTPEGEVGDAQLLSSNTVHLLNLAALSAAMQWRFAVTRDAEGTPRDGWRIIPFRFRTVPGSPLPADSTVAGDPAFVPPRVVKAVVPEFPFEAQRRKVQGTVVYRVRVDAQGRLQEAILEESVDPLVDQAALEAIERTRFLPATRQGVPVPGELRMPFPFGPAR